MGLVHLAHDYHGIQELDCSLHTVRVSHSFGSLFPLPFRCIRSFPPCSIHVLGNSLFLLSYPNRRLRPG